MQKKRCTATRVKRNRQISVNLVASRSHFSWTERRRPCNGLTHSIAAQKNTPTFEQKLIEFFRAALQKVVGQHYGDVVSLHSRGMRRPLAPDPRHSPHTGRQKSIFTRRSRRSSSELVAWLQNDEEGRGTGARSLIGWCRDTLAVSFALRLGWGGTTQR